MAHILRENDGHIEVGHYTPVIPGVPSAVTYNISTGGEFNVLRTFGVEDINEAAAWVNYLNGGLGVMGPDVDFIVAEIIRAIKLNPPGG